jgi:hypothetical protein
MISGYPQIQYRKSVLAPVPAIHCRYPFAAIVRRQCEDKALRPSAIAVELGPCITQTAIDWIKELTQSGKLPILMGLMRRNRLIKASMREKAIHLQEKTGCSLSDLPDDILHAELGLFKWSLFPLSSSDSLVEALRCGMEYDIQVYGIDLEESPHSEERSFIQIEAPETTELTYPDYLRHTAHHAALDRDIDVDIRREIAMTARLKTLLERHDRVLFTGGMAHWPIIVRLLEDTSLKSAPCPQADPALCSEFIKVIVHPAEAIQFMDFFPAVTAAYESWRSDMASPLPDLQELFQKGMEAVYTDYFYGEAYDAYNYPAPDPKSLRHRQLDLDLIPRFENFLKNLSVLNSQPVPYLPQLAAAASEIMSKTFATRLL